MFGAAHEHLHNEWAMPLQEGLDCVSLLTAGRSNVVLLLLLGMLSVLSHHLKCGMKSPRLAAF